MSEACKVNILNQSFSIQTEDDPRHVQDVANLVNKKIVEIQNQTKKASSLHVALLACMNIADEFLKYRGGKSDSFKQAEKKVHDLLELVEMQL
jgi:cell division protein ZapA